MARRSARSGPVRRPVCASRSSVWSEQEPALATEAAAAALATLGGLLATLIGEALTMRVLRAGLAERLPRRDPAGGAKQHDRQGPDPPTCRPACRGSTRSWAGGCRSSPSTSSPALRASGKTTLAQQIMFTLAEPDRPALYFTVLGEPPVKMLRYQQQFTFFDAAKVNDSIRFINVGEEVLEGASETDPEAHRAGGGGGDPRHRGRRFFSNRRASGRGSAQPAPLEMQHFVQQLGIHLTGWEATTFLVGEYQTAETEENPIFTVADGLLWLYQSVDRNSVVRKMQVVKMRGQASIPGLHTFRITGDGDTGLSARHRRSRGEAGAGRPPAPSGGREQRLSTRHQAPGRDAGRGHPGRILGRSWRVPPVPARRSSPRNSSPRACAATSRASSRSSRSAPASTHRSVARGKTLGRLVADRKDRHHPLAAARPLDRRDLARPDDGDTSPQRAPAGDRLAVGIRARAGPHVSRGLSRIALSHGRGAHRDGRHGHDDRGARGQLRRSALQPARDGIPDRRDHHAAVHRVQGPIEAHHGRGQSARERTQERAAGVRDHRGRHRRG